MPKRALPREETGHASAQMPIQKIFIGGLKDPSIAKVKQLRQGSVVISPNWKSIHTFSAMETEGLVVRDRAHNSVAD